MWIQNQSSLALVKPSYRKLLLHIAAAGQSRFGESMVAYYLLGSVGRGEDIPGVSDLDTEMILNLQPNSEDEAWAQALCEVLEPQFPELYRIELLLMPSNAFQQEDMQRGRFILKTDGVLVAGEDISLEFEDFSPGPELARILNGDYHKTLAMIRRDLASPSPEDQENPRYIAEYMRWIAKKILRLALGIVMHHQPVYTRSMENIAKLFLDIFPEEHAIIKGIQNQYMQPVNVLEPALAFLDEAETRLYRLADLSFGRS